jgi:hypothetical protein
MLTAIKFLFRKSQIFTKITLIATLVLAIPTIASAVAYLKMPLWSVSEGSADDSNHDGIWDTWAPPGSDLLAYKGSPGGYNYHAVLEFDTSPLPSNAVIVDATFRIMYDGASGHEADSLKFNSYVGDGIVTFADCVVNNQIGPLYNGYAPPNGGYYYYVPATSFIQSLVDNHQRYAGFMIENLEQIQTAFISSSSRYWSWRPQIQVTYYTVPEPSPIALLGMGAVSVIVCARRRKM